MDYNPRGKINGFTLKMIAIITMLIDHTAAAILERALNCYTFEVINQNRQAWVIVYYILRLIGRMAFPIFIYLLVEGFLYTRSAGKYALRLLVFAMISELPFDLAFSYANYWYDNYDGVHWYTHWIGLLAHQNVFWTLGIGMLAMWAMEALRTAFYEKEDSEKLRGLAWMMLRVLLQIVIAGIAMIAAYILRTDYGQFGVAAILVMYLLRNYRIIGLTLAIGVLSLQSNIEIIAILMLLPVYFYNGERGKQMKYFFYGFYPVHLLVLTLIAAAIGLPIFAKF